MKLFACIVVVVVNHLVTLKKFCCRKGGDGLVGDVSVEVVYEVEVIARALHDFCSSTGLNSLGML
jgi:hypothetical protein